MRLCVGGAECAWMWWQLSYVQFVTWKNAGWFSRIAVCVRWRAWLDIWAVCRMPVTNGTFRDSYEFFMMSDTSYSHSHANLKTDSESLFLSGSCLFWLLLERVALISLNRFPTKFNLGRPEPNKSETRIEHSTDCLPFFYGFMIMAISNFRPDDDVLSHQRGNKFEREREEDTRNWIHWNKKKAK